MFEVRYQQGLADADSLRNGEIALAIQTQARTIKAKLQDEGFDRHVADDIERRLGYICGVADRINL